jgi:hypothetical protein
VNKIGNDSRIWLIAGTALVAASIVWVLLQARDRDPNPQDVSTALEWYYHGAGIADCGPKGDLKPFKVENVEMTSLEKVEAGTYIVVANFDVRPTGEVYVPDLQDFVWTLKAKVNGAMDTYREMKDTGKMEAGCNLTRFTLLSPYLMKTSPGFEATTGVISTPDTRYRLRGQRYGIYRPKHEGRWHVNDRPIVTPLEVPKPDTQMSIER